MPYTVSRTNMLLYEQTWSSFEAWMWPYVCHAFIHHTPQMLIHELRLPFQEGFPGHKQSSFFCRIVSDVEESV
jgi:hypothetical protein